MPRRCYRVRSGATIAVEADGRYRVQLGDGPAARLHPPALAPLLLVDGWRSAEEIERQLAADGNPVPASVVDNILRSMEMAGVLELHDTAWRPLQTVPWPTHRCQGCGACCQGHWIGPLDADFVSETSARMPELREKYPQLGDRRPFVRISPDDSALFLNSETGQCIFLDDELMCLLHREYGAEGKPSICRMFPHTRFEDDEQTRLGVGLMCLTHYDQVLEQEPPAAATEWQAVHETLDGGLFHYYPGTGQAALEEEVLSRLPLVEDPFLELLDAVTPTDRGAVKRMENARGLERLARTHLARLEVELAQEPVIERLAEQKGPFPAAMGRLRHLAAAGPEAIQRKLLVPNPAPAKTAEVTRLLQDALVRFLFLRQYLMFAGLQHGTAAFALGVWASIALVAGKRDAARRFGESMATWMRAIQAPSVRRALFAGPDEVDRFLTRFRRFWK